MHRVATTVLVMLAFWWSPVLATETIAAERSRSSSSQILDGKSDVDGVNYHYLLARGGAQKLSFCFMAGELRPTCGATSCQN
jgi:hypothetical protein